ERPLPETSALIGFSFYLIEYLNPVSYLGFVFHLEYLPTHFGEQYAKGLLSAGVPPAAMTFIGEHVEADVGHNRLMAEYVEHLLATERDVEDMIYAMRVTSNLYAKVFEAAFRSVDEGAPYSYGVNRAELEAGTPNELRQILAA
ncbi:MAG: iron-containing redox enzyme family protein, partial [Acidobacteriota bacterium]